MLHILKRATTDKDVISLIEKLDAYLKISDGEDHDFYNQFNGTDTIEHMLVAYKDEVPVGCGAIKHFDASRAEVKRMFVDQTYRGQGIAAKLLAQLEQWAKEKGYKKCILETGERQVAAVQLYQKSKYKRMHTNYGQYKGIAQSICFEKTL